MNYWVVSPNVTNNPSHVAKWKELIAKNEFAFMGWDEDHSIGKKFIDDIKPGDFILIAQGANWQKKLFVGGIVDSEALYGKVDGAPAEVYYRRLSPALSQAELEDLNLDFKDSAYGEANRIPALYQLYPEKNSADNSIAVKLGQGIQLKINKLKMKELKELLEYRKQIILQGPPGTGKTRLAKQIARDLTSPASINKPDILRHVKIGEELITTSNTAAFTITKILEDRLEYVRKSTGNIGAVSFKDVIEAYENKIWLKGEIIGGSNTYSATVAKYICDNYESDQTKLIQFHPAYSYEDFVRGITANATANGIEYRTEDKVLAEFARIALENWIASSKQPQEIALDRWLDDQFEIFKDGIADELLQHPIKISPTHSIVEVGEKAFRFQSENWYDILRYSEIKKIYLYDIHDRKQLANYPDIAKTVYHRTTYYFPIVERFRGFLKGKEMPQSNQIKVALNNYVLLIDEINRANLPAVLGELIYALEYRGESVDSMYDIDGDRKLILPPNLYIVGTMNTADRSVGHIDYAIRRRFAFVDVLPKEISELTNNGKKLFRSVAKLFCEEFKEENLNLKNSKFLAADFKPTDVILGHSYFLVKEEDREKLKIPDDEILEIKLKYEIEPLLREYIKDGILSKETEAEIAKLKVGA